MPPSWTTDVTPLTRVHRRARTWPPTKAQIKFGLPPRPKPNSASHRGPHAIRDIAMTRRLVSRHLSSLLFVSSIFLTLSISTMSHNPFLFNKAPGKAATPTHWTTGPPVSTMARPSDILRDFDQLDDYADLLVSFYDDKQPRDIWADGNEALLWHSWRTQDWAS